VNEIKSLEEERRGVEEIKELKEKNESIQGKVYEVRG